jgi:mannose-6-phosphate isomerase
MDHDRHTGGRLGLAQVRLDNGDCPYLKDLVDSNPEGLLGKAHVDRFGPDLAVLVKLLDAQRQLGLQCHPDRAFAREAFQSAYGKVECWYVLRVREDSPEAPYLLLGFREGVTRGQFEALYLKDDIRALERLCHKIPAVPGDMYLVGAGVPHAIGPGCFVIEVQEPSDITVGAHPRRTGDPVTDQAFDARVLGSYHFEGRGEADNLKAWRVPQRVLRQEPGGREIRLIGTEQTPFFGASRMVVSDSLSHRETGTFAIAVVTGGTGWISWPDGLMELAQGDELFLPAGLVRAVWHSSTEASLEVVLCHPPEVLD